MMKRAMLFAALLFVLAFSGFSVNPVAGVSSPNSKERAVVTFTRPIQLMNVTLKGEYLFVHDDAAMARGEACTYVYEGTAQVSSKLVISFHCIPQPRTKANSFTIRSRQLPSGGEEIREFQFAGEKEAHAVPKVE